MLTNFRRPPSQTRSHKYTIILALSLTIIILTLYSYTSNSTSTIDRSFHTAKISTAPPDNDSTPPSVNYAVVIDAGSAGTRIYVYTWDWKMVSGHELHGHIMDVRLAKSGNGYVEMKITPGLSSYIKSVHDDDAEHLRKGGEQAYASLLPLLDYASSHVPPEMRMHTPIYLLATAGLRLCTKQQQHAVLSAIRTGLKTYPYFISTASHVRIISGADEGIYAWLALNYALDRLTSTRIHGTDNDSKPSTAGMIEMGGASIQVAFQVPHDSAIPAGYVTNLHLHMHPPLSCYAHAGTKSIPTPPSSSKYDIDTTVRLYVTTYLGYGSNAIRAKYVSYLLSNGITSDPCLLKGVKEDVNIDASVLHPSLVQKLRSGALSKLGTDTLKQLSSQYRQVSIPITGTGSFYQCRYHLTSLLYNISSLCTHGSCTFDNTFQPPLPGLDPQRHRHMVKQLEEVERRRELEQQERRRQAEQERQRVEPPKPSESAAQVTGTTSTVSSSPPSETEFERKSKSKDSDEDENEWVDSQANVEPAKPATPQAQTGTIVSVDASIVPASSSSIAPPTPLSPTLPSTPQLVGSEAIVTQTPQTPAVLSAQSAPPEADRSPSSSPSHSADATKLTDATVTKASLPSASPLVALGVNHTALAKPVKPIRELLSIPDTITTSEFYGFSEFWYTSHDLYRLTGPYSFHTFTRRSVDWCAQHWTDVLTTYESTNMNMERLRLQCFKSAWMVTFLHDGIGMSGDVHEATSTWLQRDNSVQNQQSQPDDPGSITFHPLNTLNGEDVQWTLGALLDILSHRHARIDTSDTSMSVGEEFKDEDAEVWRRTVCPRSHAIPRTGAATTTTITTTSTTTSWSWPMKVLFGLCCSVVTLCACGILLARYRHSRSRHAYAYAFGRNRSFDVSGEKLWMNLLKAPSKR